MSTPPGDLQAAKKPKAMSSRLLTMKFMQRAAATSPATSNYPSPGHKSQANRWQSQDGDSPSSAKRPRLSGQSGVSDNFSPTSPSDVRAALASVEATRQAALERSWRGGETKWSFALRERGEYQAQDGFRIELLNDQSINAINEDVESIPLWRAEEGQGRKVFGSKRKVSHLIIVWSLVF